MRTVECKLDEAEFQAVTAEAKRLGVYRSELIRSRVIAATPTPSVGAPTTADYMNIVAALRRRMGNSIGRAQAEQATAIVLQCLHG